LNKRADVFWRCLGRCNLHTCLFLDATLRRRWGNCIPLAAASAMPFLSSQPNAAREFETN
jgi:hypothetical protein